MALCAGELWAAADPEQVAVKSWATSDGLPSNEVTMLAQTTDGYLWVGTSAGLARFDGARFKVFGPEHGLSGMPITELVALPGGGLWIKDKKNDRYWLQKGKFVRDTRAWRYVVAGGDGKTYAYSDREVIILNAEGEVSGAPIPFPVQGSPGTGELHVTKEGRIWMIVRSSDRTVEAWSYGDGRWSDLKEYDRLLNNDISVWFLGTDREHASWFKLYYTEEYNVLKLNGSDFETISLPSQFRGDLRAIAEDGRGTLWAGGWGGGLWRWQGEEPKLQPLTRSEQQPSITALLRGSRGELWAGTADEGLFLLRPARVVSHRINLSATGRVTALLPEDDGVVLVGTEGSGIYWWRPESISRLGGGYIYGNEFLKLSQDSFWLGGGRGLLEFHDGDGLRLTDDAFTERFEPGESIFSMCEDGEGGLWAGSSSTKLYHVRQQTVEEIEIPDGSQQSLYSLNRDKGGNIWVVDSEGMVLKISPDRQVTRYGEKELDGVPLTVSFIDSKGRMWLGTEGAGLFRREGDRFVPIATGGPRRPGCVMQIQEDAEGWLWLGTPDGICGFDPSLLPAPPPLLWLGPEDGMESEQCTRMRAARDGKGRLYFGTARGFSMFDPAEVKCLPVLPTPVIEELNVGIEGAFSPWAGRGDVPPGKPFEVTFTGLGPELAGDMRFRYRLTGLEEEWSEARDGRTAMYSRVPPGGYRFELQAGRQGHWNTSASMLPVRVAPFLWQTWWFRLFLFLALSAVVAGLMKLMERRQLRKARAELERDKAVNEERSRIARDLHDSLGAGLTQVNMLTQFWEEAQALPAPAVKLKARLRSLSVELDNAVWATNPAFDDVSAVCDYLVTHVADFLEDSGIRCEMDLPPYFPAISLSPMARQHLLQAVKEALANVVRHADATRVHFGLHVEKGLLRVIVRDNGKGFDPQEATKKRRNGLHHLQHRLQLAGGETIIETSSAGTTVELIMPLRPHTVQHLR